MYFGRNGDYITFRLFLEVFFGHAYLELSIISLQSRFWRVFPAKCQNSYYANAIFVYLIASNFRPILLRPSLPTATFYLPFSPFSDTYFSPQNQDVKAQWFLDTISRVESVLANCSSLCQTATVFRVGIVS